MSSLTLKFLFDQMIYLFNIKILKIMSQVLHNKTPAKAFTPPAKTKMITRPGRAVTRAFIGGVVYSLISVLPNEFLFKSVIITVPSKAF